MEATIQAVINNLPNLGVAIWMLYQQQMTIRSLLDAQGKLVDRLLNYVGEDKAADAK